MPQLAELPEAISEYLSGRTSLDDFEDWFRTTSRRMFGEDRATLAACLHIEEAFSQMRYEDIPEIEFRLELANARRLFWRQPVVTSGVLLRPQLFNLNLGYGSRLSEVRQWTAMFASEPEMLELLHA